MAIHYLNSIDLNKNELKHAVIENQASDALAETGVDGQLYFNTSDNVLKIWKNGGWKLVDSTVTYDLATADTGTAITLTGSDSTTDSITISGTGSEVEVTRQSGTELRIGLPDDVTISSQLVVGTSIGTQAPVIHAKSGGDGANLYLESFSNSAEDGPDLVMYRNTAPHATGDYLGSLKFRGEEIAGGYSVDYATMSVVMTGTESASVVFDATTPNTDRTALFAIHGDEDGKVIVNPASATTIPTHTLDVNGDADISSNLGVGGNLVVSGNLQVTGTVTTNNVETVSTSNGVIFEGNAADENELTLLAGTLTADRTVTLPNATGTIALTSDLSNATITVTAGDALTGGGTFTLNGSATEITINHENTSGQASVNNSGRTYIQDITLDTYGHITGITSATETVVDTNTQLSTREADIDVSNPTFITNKRATINHALDSENVIVQMYDKTTGAVVYADVEHTSNGSTISKNHVRIEFGVVPTNDIRVIMIDAKDAATAIAPSYS